MWNLEVKGRTTSLSLHRPLWRPKLLLRLVHGGTCGGGVSMPTAQLRSGPGLADEPAGVLC
uniref:Uncharacterized protein n=1 Tax=Arundo donax TaxID=35708 RepID=A0A0A8YPH5_ARUDO